MAKATALLNAITLDRIELNIEHLVEKLDVHEATSIVDRILDSHGVKAFANVADSVISEYGDNSE